MPARTILHLRDLDALRSHAVAWDDLWQRSALTHSTGRAALIDCWVRHFADPGRFQAVAVVEQGRLVAALPLLERRKRRLLTCQDVPGNEWSSAGQLLLDNACDTPAVGNCLVEALLDISCRAYWFASIPLTHPAWCTLAEAFSRAHCHVQQQPRYRVGYVHVPDTGERLGATWSSPWRRRIERSLRRLRSSGQLVFRLERPGSAVRALEQLDRGLQLEDQGWKGRAATSVLTNPQAHAFMRDQAKQLAACQQLQLAYLEHDDRLIAFEYGWRAKQVYHSYKVAYDEDYRRYSPGQLLILHLLQQFQDDATVQGIDFLGPVDEAVRRWRPDCYSMGRLLVTRPGPTGRALAFAARHQPLSACP